jgi:hypothetical protein
MMDKDQEASILRPQSEGPEELAALPTAPAQVANNAVPVAFQAYQQELQQSTGDVAHQDQEEQEHPSLDNGGHPIMPHGSDNGSIDSETSDEITSAAGNNTVATHEVMDLDEEELEELFCSVCFTDSSFPLLFYVGCEHLYCADCIRHVVTFTNRSEQYFPPHCMRCSVSQEPDDDISDIDDRAWNIDDVPIANILGDELLADYHVKMVEYATIDRIYCFNTQCPTNPTFIAPQNIRGTEATCNSCGKVTCNLCEREKHDGDCGPQDEQTMQLHQLADEEGWKRYNRCNRLVERSGGCNHMV